MGVFGQMLFKEPLKNPQLALIYLCEDHCNLDRGSTSRVRYHAALVVLSRSNTIRSKSLAIHLNDPTN